MLRCDVDRHASQVLDTMGRKSQAAAENDARLTSPENESRGAPVSVRDEAKRPDVNSSEVG